MAEYIDREAVISAITTDGFEHFSGCISSSEVTLLEILRDSICEIPTADVAEVKHGKLNDIVDFGNGICVGYCSNCGTEHRAINPSVLKLSYRHCRWCGAKMDGKENAE